MGCYTAARRIILCCAGESNEWRCCKTNDSDRSVCRSWLRLFRTGFDRVLDRSNPHRNPRRVPSAASSAAIHRILFDVDGRAVDVDPCSDASIPACSDGYSFVAVSVLHLRSPCISPSMLSGIPASGSPHRSEYSFDVRCCSAISIWVRGLALSNLASSPECDCTNRVRGSV
jgi:hypothetical protein